MKQALIWLFYGPPALWNKDPEISKAWEIMEKEVEEELSGK